MTPIVFFELYFNGTMVPCLDPAFVAVKLTKKLLSRLRRVQALMRRHRLCHCMILPEGLPVEVFASSVMEPTVEIGMTMDVIQFTVHGRRFDSKGELGLIENLADSWLVSFEEIEDYLQSEHPVWLHQWDDSMETEESLIPEPFGCRVFAYLQREGAYRRYQRREWFDAEYAEALFDLEPALWRDERRRRKSEGADSS